MKSVVAVVSFLVAGISRVDADPSGAQLYTDRPVYKHSGSQKVKITLINTSTQPLYWTGSIPWTIWQGDTLWYNPGFGFSPTYLYPGEIKTWQWSRRGVDNSLVPAGSYTIKMNLHGSGTTTFQLSRTIAITPSGFLGGANRFPLAVGSEWTFEAWESPTGNASPITMKVVDSWANGAWFRITNLASYHRWVRMTGTVQPTLWAIPDLAPPVPGKFLFKFDRALNYSYFVSLPPFPTGTKFKVGSKTDTVDAPVGTFTNCYRLDVVDPTNAPTGWGYKSFTFAQGVGLVAFVRSNSQGLWEYRLRSAKVKGPDGQVYTIAE